MAYRGPSGGATRADYASVDLRLEDCGNAWCCWRYGQGIELGIEGGQHRGETIDIADGPEAELVGGTVHAYRIRQRLRNRRSRHAG